MIQDDRQIDLELDLKIKILRKTAMACFLLLHMGYDTEVIFCLSFGYDTGICI